MARVTPPMSPPPTQAVASPLTIVVTGATGFLGRRVVDAARARGHGVVAIHRRSPPAAWMADTGIRPIRLDLAAEDDRALSVAVHRADAVIHVAAALTGDDAAMGRDTLDATRHLLDTMARNGVPRLVLASSLSVYAGAAPGQIMHEHSLLELRPDRRDAYTRAKLAQERLVRNSGLPEVWLLRIGQLYGPGRTDGPHVALRRGPVTLRLDAGPIPVAYVDHAAEALVRAAETRPSEVEILNIVDSDLPDARRWLGVLPDAPRWTLPVPFGLLDRVAGRVGPRLGGGPGLLRPEVVRARLSPRVWPNRRARDRLGWAPRWSFDEAMARSLRSMP